MATAKTNAIRLLDRLGVPFELRAYEVDPEDLAAETVARKVVLPPEQIFKARSDGTGTGSHLSSTLRGPGHGKVPRGPARISCVERAEARSNRKSG